MAKAEKIAGLDGDTTFTLAIAQVIEQRFDEMLQYKTGTLLGEDPEALHDMRVASRRLRAAMDVAVVCFPKPYSSYHTTIKRLTDVLGGVRDDDVMRDALTDYRQSRPDAEHAAINHLLQRQLDEREAHRVDLLAFFTRLDDEHFDVRFRGFLKEQIHG